MCPQQAGLEQYSCRWMSAPTRCVDYLACISDVARSLGHVCGSTVQPEQVEMFLFTFGRNLKAPSPNKRMERNAAL